MQRVGCMLSRVMQQVATGVGVRPLGQQARRTFGALAKNCSPHTNYWHTLRKVCWMNVQPGATPCRGMATPSLTWDAVLSKENKANTKARLLSAKIPRVLKQTGSPVAAVLVPLCWVEGELSLLYTVRCCSLAAHAGEVSFPGGMADPGDRDLVHTAMREAQEEVGLGGGQDAEVLGVLPPVASNLDGTQVVGVLAYLGHLDPATLKPNPGEVEAVMAASLRNLCRPSLARQTQFRSVVIPRGYTLPVFLGTEPRVWGLTAIFTHMALTALLPGLYTHRLRHVPPLLPPSTEGVQQ